VSEPELWREQAACRDTPHPDRFFSELKSTQRLALAVCEACPVTAACLAYAVDAGLPGVWGGTTHLERLLAAAGRRSCSEGHELTVGTAFVRQKSASYSLACLVCNRAWQAAYKQRVRAAAKEVTA
jgi:WhiB family redox-sensing transcriptional regulator